MNADYRREAGRADTICQDINADYGRADGRADTICQDMNADHGREDRRENIQADTICRIPTTKNSAHITVSAVELDN